MKLNLKKGLLLGTALVAVSFAGHQAQAADVTASASGIWSSAATNTDDGTLAEAEGGEALIISGDGVTVTVTNDATANDSGGVNAFSIGAITDTSAANDGAITVTTGAAANMTLTTGAVTIDGTFTIINVAADGDIGVTAASLATATGNLVVNNADATTPDALSLVVTNALSVGGTTAITAGANAGAATSTVSVGANATFTGAVTVTGGANAAADATLTLSGATNAFTAGLVLDDGVAGSATLVFDGAAAQTVSGTINAASATDEGTVNILAGANSVTFADNIGATATNLLAVNIGSAGAGGNAVFNGNVEAATITVLGEHADDAVVDFNGNVVGALVITSGGTAGELATVTSAGNITGTTTFTTGGGADVPTLTFDGTTAQTVTGDITGAGTLNVNNDVTVAGRIGAAAVTAANVATGKTFTLSTTNAANAITTTTLTGTGTFVYDTTNAGGASTLTGTVVSAADGNGTLRFTGAENAIVTGAVGASGTDVGAIQVNALATGASVLLSGDVYTNGVSIDATNATDENTVTFGNGADTLSVTGNITSAENDEHTLVFNSSTAQTVTGNIGASGSVFKAITVSEDLTVGGNVYATATTIDAADTLTLNGTSAQMVSGTIATGNVSIAAGSNVTFAGAVAGVANTLAANSKATYNAGATLTGAYTQLATSTTTVGVGSTLSALSLSDAGSYVLQASDANGTLAAADFGSLTDSGGGAATLTAANVTIDVTGNMTTGTVQLLTNVALGTATLVDNSYQYTFTVADNGVNSDVTVAKRSINSMGTSSANSSLGTVLDANSTSANVQIAAIVDNVAAAASAEAVNEVLEAVTATVDGGASVAAFSVAAQSSAVVSDRMAALRSGDETGMVAGDMGQGMKAWGQVFGSKATMDTRDGVDGFDADTFGFAVGVDTSNISENAVVGLAFSYADTDVESKNSTAADTEIDSYQLTVYGDVDLGNDTFVTGQLGYAWNDIDTKRFNVGGINNLTATGNTDSDQFSVGATIGRDYATSHGFTVTPSFSAKYSNLSTDGYTETGAAGANLTVDYDDMDKFELGLGVKAAWEHEQADGSVFKPVLSLGYTYDVIGDEVEATSSLQGISGTSFKSKGADAEQSRFNVGAGFTYFSTDNWELSADYNFELESDYDAHSLGLKAAYRF